METGKLREWATKFGKQLLEDEQANAAWQAITKNVAIMTEIIGKKLTTAKILSLTGAISQALLSALGGKK